MRTEQGKKKGSQFKKVQSFLLRSFWRSNIEKMIGGKMTVVFEFLISDSGFPVFDQ